MLWRSSESGPLTHRHAADKLVALSMTSWPGLSASSFSLTSHYCWAQLIKLPSNQRMIEEMTSASPHSTHTTAEMWFTFISFKSNKKAPFRLQAWCFCPRWLQHQKHRGREHSRSYSKMFVQWKLKMCELVWRCHIYFRKTCDWSLDVPERTTGVHKREHMMVFRWSLFAPPLCSCLVPQVSWSAAPRGTKV